VIRVLIAAPSAVVRAGLESLLGGVPGLEVTGSFADLHETEELRPDVVLAALPLDQLNGVGDAAVVLLTEAEHPVWTAEALRMWVRATLPRDASAEAIIAAVEAAGSGMAVVDPLELEALLGAQFVAGPVSSQAVATASLTHRETEVLGLMAEGVANKEIAWRLGISEHTVKFHVASILGKLNASSRTEAVTRGLRMGLILM
jgi:NarL family two-component system response regulator YdfI